MTILKNEPIYTPGPDDYSKPRHIIVQGTNEEIGFDLAKLAQTQYGVATLEKYEDPAYGKARQEYLSRNWPKMLAKSKGVLRAYGLSEDDVEHDSTQLTFDFYDVMRGSQLDFNTCSAAVLPKEKSAGGGVFVSRNFDLMAMVLWTELQGKSPKPEAYKCWERGVVIENRPTDGGFKTILIGGHELLTPYIDGINEKGLYFSLFHDPSGIGDEGGPTAGGRMNGLAMIQITTMLLEKCATVQEAKQEILNNRIMQVMLCAHMILADASGDATIFEIDKKTQDYVFTDREKGEPLFITNHPVSIYPEPSKFPEFDKEAEHNTFQRMIIFADEYAKLKAPFVKGDATKMTDAVHCSFVDDKMAEAAPKERTLINTTADLSKPEISVRFYLGDVGPVKGTNHMDDRMSAYYTFGFN